jgi:ubiquinone/menaquinone biosynthesis C-methylase UbiE
LRSKDLLFELLKEFQHPSTALWRAVEIRCIYDTLSEIAVKAPILDLGCGAGQVFAKIFSQKCMNIGLDLSKSDLRQAKRIAAYDGLVIGDARALPFREGFFKMVFSNSVIEHIPNVDKVLQEIFRILEREGVLIFTVPSEQFGDFLFFYVLFKKLFLKKTAQWYRKKRNALLNHYNCFDAVTWRLKIERTGLTAVVFKYYLSKSAIQMWDLMAFCIFAMRRVGITKTEVWGFLSSKTRKLQVSLFRGLLNSYYKQNCEVGGGLLIVAKRRN